MPKPLADMTLDQRANHVGMWCDIFEQLDEPPVAEGIIAGYREDDDGRTLVIIGHPHAGAGEWVYRLNGVVPRYDLLRAWHPDGTPPKGEWLTHGTHTRVIPKNRRSYITRSEPDPFQ